MNKAYFKKAHAHGCMKSQPQMFYESVRAVGERDSTVMGLLNDPVNPLLPSELLKMARRWPARYGRYDGLARRLMGGVQ